MSENATQSTKIVYLAFKYFITHVRELESSMTSYSHIGDQLPNSPDL